MGVFGGLEAGGGRTLKVIGINASWCDDAERQVRRIAQELGANLAEVKCEVTQTGGVLPKHWNVTASLGNTTFEVRGNSYGLPGREEAVAHAETLAQRLKDHARLAYRMETINTPMELYSRLTVGTNSKEVHAFNYGKGDVIPGADRVATLIDTNLPSKRIVYDHLEANEFTWHITLPTVSEHLVEVQKLMDQGVWEWYIGGENLSIKGFSVLQPCQGCM